jgi:hypothetical protein
MINTFKNKYCLFLVFFNSLLTLGVDGIKNQEFEEEDKL